MDNIAPFRTACAKPAETFRSTGWLMLIDSNRVVIVESSALHRWLPRRSLIFLSTRDSTRPRPHREHSWFDKLHAGCGLASVNGMGRLDPEALHNARFTRYLRAVWALLGARWLRHPVELGRNGSRLCSHAPHLIKVSRPVTCCWFSMRVLPDASFTLY